MTVTAVARIPELVLGEHEFSVPLDHVDPGGERRLSVELS